MKLFLGLCAMVSLALALTTGATAYAADRTGVHGEVRWTGNPRRVPQMARIGHDAVCPRGLQPLVEHRRRSLAGVAVWLVPVVPVPSDPIPLAAHDVVEFLVEESGCLLTPRLAFVSPGTMVRVANIDPQRHWLVVEGRHVARRQIYHAHGAAGAQFVVAREDRVRLWSGLHRWMEAWIIAVETPWRTVTDDKGRYNFSDIPAGEYVVHAWHPELGEFTEVVSVPQRQSLTIGFARAVPRPDPELRLSIPRLRDEWVRTRGDRPYR